MMSGYSPIFTNNALRKMRQFRLSESTVLNAFNSGVVEKKPGGVSNSIKKYQGYEIGVMWKQDQRGAYVILSVWSRNRR